MKNYLPPRQPAPKSRAIASIYFDFYRENKNTVEANIIETPQRMNLPSSHPRIMCMKLLFKYDLWNLK